MTSIQVFRGQDAIHFCTDGASFSEEDGSFRSLASKVLIMPELSAGFACRGVGLFLPILHWRLQDRHLTFDALVAAMPLDARWVFETLKNIHQDEAIPDFELIFGGWSAEKERCETYSIVSHELWPEQPPWQVTPLPEFYAVPWPDAAHLEALGLMTDGRLTMAIGDMPLFMQAQRMREVPISTPHLAAGFIQRTRIGKDFSETAIVHRWNDEFGKPVMPSLAEADEIRKVASAANGD